MLTDAKLRRIQPEDGPLTDGTVSGLYFYPGKARARGKWILRYTSPATARRRDMGLGTYPEVSITDARTLALAARSQIKSGKDPIEERKLDRTPLDPAGRVPTFEEAARLAHAEIKPGFKNTKHGDQWINTLEDYVFPRIGTRPVDSLRAVDFAETLRPIWLTKPESASRVRQRCDRVMNWSAAHGHIIASPVSVIDNLLPKQPGKRERVIHHPALPWRDIPAVFQSEFVQKPPSVSRMMLELLILTATRSGEIRGMVWEELDLPRAIWTVPATRMKAKAAHRVPLLPRAVALLGVLSDQRQDANQPLVFATRRGTPYSDMVMTKALRDANVPSDVEGRVATAHGFRSSFRDWASENGYARDLAERALAHTIRNETEAAYHRTDLLEQRREMMLAWERYCLGK